MPMSEQTIDLVPGPQDIPLEAEFDLGAWLTDARPPTKHVRVIGAGHLLGEYEQLAAELSDLRAVGAANRPGMLVGTVDREAQRIVSDLDQIRSAIDASTIELQFQALSYEAQQAADAPARGADGKFDVLERQAQWVSAGCVSHSMTVEQARHMRLAIGDGQFDACFNAVWTISQQQVTVPFSLAHSTAGREG